MGRKLLMKGNEALAEAAIRAGCKLFFGYPITPQTELSEYMAKNMPKRGGLSLQAESEIAAINMVLGASLSTSSAQARVWAAFSRRRPTTSRRPRRSAMATCTSSCSHPRRYRKSLR